MKIYAYNVDQKGSRAIEALTDTIIRRGIGDRIFSVDATLRLEERSLEGDFLRLNFAFKRGGHGPGRYLEDRPLESFDVGENNSGFGEDTALIVHLPSSTVAVQYNHHGPKIKHIEQYLYAADLKEGLSPAVDGVADEDRCGFEFGVVLTPDAMEKVRNFGLYRKINFTVAVPGVQRGDLERGRGLGEVLGAPFPEGVETLQMSIGATTKKGSRLSSVQSMRWIQDLLNLGPAVLKRAVVEGRPTEDDLTDPVDLIADRVCVERPIRLGHGLRYTVEDRWNALEQGWESMRERGLLPL
ncbi:hypothetical protein [Stappia sp.]|uniref:hypothetical protein n=1 Tax=Stappia sp. TaxID=1870903 RepID=UPI003C79FE5E